MTDKIQINFEKFHALNPEVYHLWCRFTQQMLDRGLDTGSASMVAERIRWETSVVTTGMGVKLNNNYRSRYARLWMEEHPQHAGYFRTRTLREHSSDSVRF